VTLWIDSWCGCLASSVRVLVLVGTGTGTGTGRGFVGRGTSIDWVGLIFEGGRADDPVDPRLVLAGATLIVSCVPLNSGEAGSPPASFCGREDCRTFKVSGVCGILLIDPVERRRADDIRAFFDPLSGASETDLEGEGVVD